MKIKRPEWASPKIERKFSQMSQARYEQALPYEGDDIKFLPSQVAFLAAWFTEHIEGRWVVDPKDAVEAYGLFSERRNCWAMDQQPCDTDTHKAYLIYIEPIKQESAADVLKDCIDAVMSVELKARAKAALERER